jgi:hypothetical protein
METKLKDPDAVLDYLVDWDDDTEDWLGTDTISTSEFIAESGITINSHTNTPTTATVWLSGGTTGTKYKITNRITTAGGRTNDQSFYVKIKEM